MINTQRLVDTFCEIVRIDSVSREEDAIAKDLTYRLKELGLDVVEDKFGNLVTVQKEVNPLILSAHMDTVEPGRGIKPKVVDGKIVSDGTTILGGDCKAGVASILEAIASLRDDNTEHIPFQVVFTRGEEIGLIGAAHLDFDLLHGQNIVVFDGNGPVNTITSMSPTSVHFDVKVVGRAAHAGVEPEKGLSAIRIAADIIMRLPQGRLDPETTMNIGKISGGLVRNAVPAEAEFAGEFRSRNAETVELLKLQVSSILEHARDTYKDAKIEQDAEVMFKMYQLDAEDPILKMVSSIMNSMGLSPNPRPSGGGTDANIFIDKGFDAVVVGMATNAMHTVNEYVIVDELRDAATFCEHLVKPEAGK